jgi:hypothetical protein
MVAGNRRRDRRVNLAHDAVIHARRKLIAKCAVLDISKSGARISIDQSVALPVEFTLQMSRNGGVCRQCQLIWRTDDQIGVRFSEGIGRSLYF